MNYNIMSLNISYCIETLLQKYSNVALRFISYKSNYLVVYDVISASLALGIWNP